MRPFHLTHCQRDSLYPEDLIQLWEDHSSIASFVTQLGHDPRLQEPASSRFDTVYEDLLTRHPDVVLVLRARMFARNALPLWSILNLYGLTYRVFQPFLQFRELIESPFPRGDSPIYFLANPRRAMALWCDHQNTAEEVMIRWIHHAREVLAGRKDDWLHA